MKHSERAEALLEEAARYPVHSAARASYLAEAQVRAQLALVELVELAARPPVLVIPEPAQEAAPEKPATPRRRTTKKPTEAAT